MTQDPTDPAPMDAKLQAEIEAALGDISIEDMLDYTDAPTAAAQGSGRSERPLKTGTVVAIHGSDVLVEFGPKSNGICPLSQFGEAPEVGEQLAFVVDRFDEKEGMLLLSREGAVRKAEWEALDIGQVVEARCTGVNKGGLEMEIAKHKAFMPAGHVDVRHIDDLAVFVGEKMPCEIMELDKRRGRIVLSRRLPLEADRARMRDKVLDSLEEGQTVPGVITSIRDFGAFADLGGVDGLIHISDLSWERVKHPSEVVKEGQQVNVKVLKLERESERGSPRISLGLKQTLEDPYTASAGQLDVGADVTGRVTRVADFGAFVELSPGVEGLIHISELSRERVRKVSDVVQEGEVVTVRVVSIDHDRRRIGLSLKATKAQEEEANVSRNEDPMIRKMKAQLSEKFGDNLKGGLG